MPSDTGTAPVHNIRTDAETWKRFRLAALEDDMTLGEELGALLDLRDRSGN